MRLIRRKPPTTRDWRHEIPKQTAADWHRWMAALSEAEGRGWDFTLTKTGGKDEPLYKATCRGVTFTSKESPEAALLAAITEAREGAIMAAFGQAAIDKANRK